MPNNSLPIKQMPTAIEAEAAVIGSIFLEPSSIMIARDSISSEDVYDMKNELI